MIHVYSAAGAYSAGLRVTDDRGGTGTDTAVIIVAAAPLPNDPPVADISADLLYGDEPLSVQFDASASSDPDGSIVEYEWDFDGDGNFEEYGTNPARPYNFESFGLYPALVRVTDDDGAVSTATVEIRVNEVFDHPAPWPMYGHDYRRTFRSQYVGPQEPEILWEYNVGISPVTPFSYQTPISGPNGEFYVVNGGFELLCMDNEGLVRWRFIDENGVLSMAIAGSHGVACGTGNGVVLLDWQGEVIWRLDTGGSVYRTNYNTQADSLDILVRYFETPSVMKRVHMNGGEAWTCVTGSFYGGNLTQARFDYTSDGSCIINKTHYVVIGDDGTIEQQYDAYSGSYVGIMSDDTIVLHGSNGDIIAVNRDGTEMWRTNLGIHSYYRSTVQGDCVYLSDLDGTLYCVDTDGTLKWDYSIPGSQWSGAKVSEANELYILNTEDDYERNLYVFNADGSLKWSKANIWSYDITIRSNGSLITGNTSKQIVSIDAGGNVEWEQFINGGLYYKPIELTDGTVVGVNEYSGFAGKLVIVGHDGELVTAYDGNYSRETPLAVGVDSIYLGTSHDVIVSVSTDGQQKWRCTTWDSNNWSPTISPSGDVTFSSETNLLQTYSPDGELSWSGSFGYHAMSVPVLHHNQYTVNTRDGLASIDSTGNITWEREFTEYVSYPVYSPTGKLHCVSDDGLYCLNASGDLEWKRIIIGLSRALVRKGYYNTNAPSVGVCGTVYLSCGRKGLYAIGTDGELQWVYEVENYVETTPAIAKSGNIVIGCSEGIIHSIAPDGNLSWAYQCEGVASFGLAIDTEDTVYALPQSYESKKIVAINSDGTLKWSSDLPYFTRSTPILGDGVLYIICDNGKLYAIGTDTGSPVV